MGIFALGLTFNAGQTVRPASVTLRKHQLLVYDSCRHILCFLMEKTANIAAGMVVKRCHLSSLSIWTGDYLSQNAFKEVTRELATRHSESSQVVVGLN